MLDSAQTGVGIGQRLGQRLLNQMTQVRMVQCGSKQSVPISGLNTLKFWWVWDMAY